VLDALPYKEARDLLIYDPYSTAVYQAFYIDRELSFSPTREKCKTNQNRTALVDAIRSAPRTAFTIIIEPAAFPRFFNATSGVIHGLALVRSYRENIRYALKALNLPNVVMYLDVGHAYSLDWVQHGNAAADAVVSVYNASGRPAQLRGFATNVANFNAW
jgi:cellulose 1,4-beta-cellobiosidase